MFSGIIQAIGTVEAIAENGTTRSFRIASSMSAQLRVDQSICHDGICLTVVKTDDTAHTVEVILETLSKTIFDHIHTGYQVNLEKSISLNTLLDGHLVQGHIDTTLQCLEKKDLNGSWNFKFNLPAKYSGLVIPHGSICLNGVSLTIANLYDDQFEVAIIPYTFHHTNFQYLQAGDRVNVEFDLIGKYIAQQIKSPVARPGFLFYSSSLSRSTYSSPPFTLTSKFSNAIEPVPAGIRLPTITFSFNPCNSSRLAAIAALLNTFVVSWKDAAEIQLLVPNDERVIPCNIGLEVAATASRYSSMR